MTDNDLAIATLRRYMAATVIEEYPTVTETMPEQAETEAPNWEAPDEPQAAYPELPDNPHNHIYTWSPKLPDGSMLVVRSQSAHDLVGAVEALAPYAGRLKAAWDAVTGTPQPQGPPFGPNVSVPQAPGYQGPPPQQQGYAPQQQFQQQAPAWQQPQQNGGGQGGAYPAPQGWLRTTARKEQIEAVAAQYGIPKGNPSKGGKFNFFKAPQTAWYVAPDVAGAFAAFNPVQA